MTEEEKRKVQQIWSQYEDGLSFQRTMGFSEKFPEYERFKTGDQWPQATERTKALPRPVFNIIDLFISNKKSNVLNQNIKMVFSSAEAGTMDGSEETALHAVEGAQKYTQYAEALWYELDQDGLNDNFVENAATTGTGILHYYWDQKATGGSLHPYVGTLKGENIDPLNLFVANPQEPDIQKQEWVMISSRMDLKKARAMAAEAGLDEKDVALIQADGDSNSEGYDAAVNEQNGSEKTTVLTRYSRKDGEVVFSRCTSAVLIVDEKPLTPEAEEDEELPLEIFFGGGDETASALPETEALKSEEGAAAEEGEAALEPEQNPAIGIEEVLLSDPSVLSEMLALGTEPAKITRYPVVVFPWKTRKKCLWGYGEVEGLIPNQKAINFNVGMMLLSVQDNAWPKLVTKPGALRQNVTNMPGEILTDYYSSGDGVKYMQPPNFNYMAVNLVDKVMELSRTTRGVTEISTGEQLGANMAASAIIALQNQAKVPIDNIQKRFYRSIRDVGKIWEEFFKTYYSMPRTMLVSEAGSGTRSELFLGEEYQDVDFDLKIDVGPTSMYSESLSMATLEKLYDTGGITLDEYIELAPHNVMPFKDKLKELLQRRQTLGIRGMGTETPAAPQGTASGPASEMAAEFYSQQQDALTPQVEGLMSAMGAQA